jgi:hypothetical protein
MGAIADQSPVAEQDASHIVLVVEDEVLVRMMFTDQLRAIAYLKPATLIRPLIYCGMMHLTSAL